MPPAIPRACRHRSCKKTTTDRSGYCNDHINTGWSNYQNGKSRHERGYGNKWDKLKRQIKERDNHLCQQCKRNGIVVKGTTVDHIKPKVRGGTDDLNNLELLCWPCHLSKTALERC